MGGCGGSIPQKFLYRTRNVLQQLLKPGKEHLAKTYTAFELAWEGPTFCVISQPSIDGWLLYIS